MRKLIMFALMLTFAACAGAPGPALQQPAKNVAIEASLQATIALHASWDDTICAGERVSPTLILTAYHCVAAAALTYDELIALEEKDADLNDVPWNRIDGERVKFSTYAQVLEADTACSEDSCPLLKKTPGTVVAGDALHDLALIHTDTSDQPFVPLRSEPVVVGEHVYSIGHPAGYVFRYAEGAVASPCRYVSTSDGAKSVCFLDVDITVWGGSSGGGLYDLNGQLVGLTSMMRKPQMGLFVPGPAIAKFVRSNS